MMKSILMAPKWTGAAAVINHHFHHLWDNLPPTVQKTARQQHHLCTWGYSHQSGTEPLPTHGPSPSRCSGLLWLNVLFAGNWGWKHREPFYLPYHKPALVIEWQRHTCSFLLDTKPLWHWGKWKSGPTNKRDPRTSVHYIDLKPLVNSYIQQFVQTKWDVVVHGRDLYLVKSTLGKPKLSST